jgi:type I restriction enzyme M protein
VRERRTMSMEEHRLHPSALQSAEIMTPQELARLEADLWQAADNLRANSNLTSNQYFMPVLGIIFLRHAANRFDEATRQIEADQASGKMPKRPLTPQDYVSRRALYLPPEARFDAIIEHQDRAGLPTRVNAAMEAIEASYEPLKGVLPKEYAIFTEPRLLEDVMLRFNSEQIKQATGDVFGRIYEYFLTRFSVQKAHDNGEFFTPLPIVQLIVNVIEPDHGKVFDPACGSGGMFVQTGHFIEAEGQDPARRVTFYGQEKNLETAHLAMMNLAVHGLEGHVAGQTNTYYRDEHELAGNCDFVMANPPFNVDEVDAEQAASDKRLPFGLPGVNKRGRVTNGNYLWISYFWSYLNETGRAGFVMSSQASNAGRGEQEMRRKIVETGDVDVMISIRSNFFYTRTVPCELWFLDRGKPAERRDTVLMIDAREVYRKLNRTINEFSPEQLKNLTAIVWLYRGERERFLEWVSECHRRAVECHDHWAGTLHRFEGAGAFDYVLTCLKKWATFGYGNREDDPRADEKCRELGERVSTLTERWYLVRNEVEMQATCAENAQDQYRASVRSVSEGSADLGNIQNDLVRMDRDIGQYDNVRSSLLSCIKDLDAAVAFAETELNAAKDRKQWVTGWGVPAECLKIRSLSDNLSAALDAWHDGRKQLRWLLDRFPDAQFQDVPGLCRGVNRAEIEAADWSLAPGRYVGVAPIDEDDRFDFQQTMGEIRLALQALDEQAEDLAKTVQASLLRLEA